MLLSSVILSKSLGQSHIPLDASVDFADIVTRASTNKVTPSAQLHLQKTEGTEGFG
jgi:hypothetical protein